MYLSHGSGLVINWPSSTEVERGQASEFVLDLHQAVSQLLVPCLSEGQGVEVQGDRGQRGREAEGQGDRRQRAQRERGGRAGEK